MDIITAVIYIVLFIILMIFVFSIGMLKPFMSKKEMFLVLSVAFLIGAIGGAFFLNPIYSDMPMVVSTVEKVVSSNEETLYLDLSSATDTNALKSDLSKIDGFKSFEETGVTITLWKFNDKEYEYFNRVLGNVDSHYTNYTINQSSGTIYIALNNYSASDALKVFSDWYRLVFGETISYAQVHAKVVVSSSAIDKVNSLLLEKGIVATSIEGPVQNSVVDTSSSMLSNTEFTVLCGFIGVFVGIISLYFDSVVVGLRRIKRFFTRKRK